MTDKQSSWEGRRSAALSQNEEADDALRALNRDRGLRYGRVAGIAVGVFLLAWLPLNSMRWEGQAPPWLLTVEWLVMGGVALLVLLPWRRIQATRWWRPLFGLLCVACVALVFTLVADLMFLYMMAADQGKKPPPPAFQSLLIFVLLMQPPLVYFLRRPELLD